MRVRDGFVAAISQEQGWHGGTAHSDGHHGGPWHHGKNLRLHPHPANPIPSPAEGSISAAACSVVDEAEADEDRISRLEDVLHSNIVSCLLIKDAAYTAALAPHLGHHAARPR